HNLIEDPGEFGDHRLIDSRAAGSRTGCQNRIVPAWCAWQIATASASAASGVAIAQPGNNRRTIICTWSFSACPAPTTDFLTRFAEYSATGRPRSAGANSTTPRATP